ncbi:MAG: DUF4097 domain-containing protein [Clostridiaceae bacterium]|nr:DUF4097 domain-containing protein [Clostridiaceae bacterium]
MKTIRIIQLIILLVIVAALIAILVIGTTGNFSMPFGNLFRNGTVSNSVLIYDQVFEGSDLKLVDTKLSSADLEYHFSQDNEIRVVYYGPESEKDEPIVKTEYDSNTLRITQQNRNSIFNMISGEKVIVYLPVDFDTEIIGDTASGNINFHENIKLDRLSLELSSGNIVIKDIAVQTVEIAVSSGRISADNISTGNYSFKLSSGNIRAAELSGQGNIISTSGNTDIDVYNGGGMIKSTSGNVDIGVSKLESDLDISLTSGNVSVDLINVIADIGCRFDVLSGRISTNFGNVDKNVAGATFRYGIDDDPANIINIKTTSGNIRANSN